MEKTINQLVGPNAFLLFSGDTTTTTLNRLRDEVLGYTEI